ncbi:hypothetical protein CEXT_625791 [Caerostris extrusa]|uniref:Uncharacterized protein n=1 Tax=Caerostris extrusa TaxID=172846 RepID=A0AAV4M965_CAEEX|nr:hypothetical protein CEXT_625791 [Caerostris extrusa]
MGSRRSLKNMVYKQKTPVIIAIDFLCENGCFLFLLALCIFAIKVNQSLANLLVIRDSKITSAQIHNSFDACVPVCQFSITENVLGAGWAQLDKLLSYKVMI